MNQSLKILKTIREANENDSPKKIEEVFVYSDKFNENGKIKGNLSFDTLINSLKKSSNFTILDIDKDKKIFSLQEKCESKRNFFLVKLKDIWTPVTIKDKQIQVLVFATNSEETKNNKEGTQTQQENKNIKSTWKLFDDNDIPDWLQTLLKSQTVDDKGNLKIVSKRNDFILNEEIKKILEFTDKEITEKEYKEYLEFIKPKNTNESLYEDDQEYDDNSNNQNVNTEDEKIEIPKIVDKGMVIYRAIEKADWILSKDIKGKNALVITKDKKQQYVLVLENNIWEFGVPHITGIGSEYLFYSRSKKVFIEADKEIKQKHQLMTEIVRRTNFSSDLYKDNPDSIAQGIGARLGMALLGPLGAKLGAKFGGKIGSYVGEKTKEVAGKITRKVTNKAKDSISKAYNKSSLKKSVDKVSNLYNNSSTGKLLNKVAKSLDNFVMGENFQYSGKRALLLHNKIQKILERNSTYNE